MQSNAKENNAKQYKVIESNAGNAKQCQTNSMHNKHKQSKAKQRERNICQFCTKAKQRFSKGKAKQQQIKAKQPNETATCQLCSLAPCLFVCLLACFLSLSLLICFSSVFWFTLALSLKEENYLVGVAPGSLDLVLAAFLQDRQPARQPANQASMPQAASQAEPSGSNLNAILVAKGPRCLTPQTGTGGHSQPRASTTRHRRNNLVGLQAPI